MMLGAKIKPYTAFGSNIYISIFSNTIIQRFKYKTKTKRGGKNRRTPEKNNHPERDDVHNI